MNALDWGSGNGHFSYFLLRLGLNVTAFNLDVQKNALAPVLERRFDGRYRFQVGPAAEPIRLPFEDRSFDMAFSVGVLEHVRETGGSEAASLRELRRVLRPGGHLICAFLPKRDSWIEFLVRRYAPNRHWHRFRYTRAELETLVAQADLELVGLRTHGFLPRNSWNHPRLRRLSQSAAVAHGVNTLDRVLERVFGPISQNHMLAAMRPSEPGA